MAERDGVRVLIVDDSPDMRTLLLYTLAGVGGTKVVGEATDGVEAVRLVGELRPDLVFLDIAMPRMDGLEAARHIRENDPDTRIICLSAYSRSKMAEDALEAGADAYLEKAAPPGDLRALLERLFPDVDFPVGPPPLHAAGVATAALSEESPDERRYRLLLDALEEGVLVLRADGVVDTANFAASRILGAPTSGLLGANVRDFGLAGDDGALGTALMSGRPASNVELPLTRPDGARLHLSVSARPVATMPVGTPDEVVLTMIDVTERRNLIHTLRTLSRCHQVLVHATDETDLLDEMCRTVVEVGGYRLAWVGYPEDDAGRTVRPVAAAGEVGYLNDIRVSWADDDLGRGPTGTAIRTGRIQVCDDMLVSARFLAWREKATRHGFRSSIVFPLPIDAARPGSLSIYAPEPGAFDAAAVSLLSELAEDLAYGINRLRDRHLLDRGMEATVGAVAAAVEARDAYTAGHQRRVAELAFAIAVRLGLDPGLAKGIKVAATLHDIGKIGVPAEILSKPALLTPAEYELIKGHAQAGSDIIAGIQFPWPVAEMVRQHHERLDGSGYPRGLAGDDIILGARILAVADVVEAMAHLRPYRAALGIDAALKEIVANSGRLFARDVVDACVALFAENRFVFSA